MILINFAHPITPLQIQQIEVLIGESLECSIVVPAQMNLYQDMVPQVRVMVDAVGLTADEWRTLSLVINLPSLSFSAALTVLELGKRMGKFPRCLHLRSVRRTVPLQFEVAEIVDLESL